MSIATDYSPRHSCVTGDRSLDSIWHKSAPSAVRKAYGAGRESAGWKAWQRHLRTRKQATQPAWLLDYSWPCKSSDTADDDRAASQELRQWLDDAAGGRFELDYAFSALEWCRRLPQLADVLPASAWWRLLDQLINTAIEANAAGDDFSGDEPLVRQLLAGELPLTLACLFPEITICQKLRPRAQQVLSTGLTDLLDGKGFLHAKHFDQLRTLLACWTRCRTLGEGLKRGSWNRKAEKQYRRFVRNALRLARRDGSLAFSDPSANRGDAELLRTATRLTGDNRNLALATLVLADAKEQQRQSICTNLPKPAVHSEWAKTALLRPNWSRSAPRLTVLYPDTSCRVELACGRDVLVSGEWALNVQINGTPAVPTSDWDELCWVSDGDVDYLELEIELGSDLRVQRHFVLAREDGFLLLADAVLGTRQATMEYRGTLPLCRDVTFREACETREGILAGRKPRATVLPLALPEWLADRRGGALAANGDGLQLQQTVAGQSLFAPLFLDLNRRRMSRRITWRQLAVGDSWAAQPADVAAGYRVAIGHQQWLIYRSLAQAKNRSVLGHNLSSETLIARFSRKGEVEPLIEIE